MGLSEKGQSFLCCVVACEWGGCSVCGGICSVSGKYDWLVGYMLGKRVIRLVSGLYDWLVGYMIGYWVICLVCGLYAWFVGYMIGSRDYMLGTQRYMLTLAISKQKNSLKGQFILSSYFLNP